MPLVDLDDPAELRARWAALAAVAHASGRDRIWWADRQGWHHEDARGNDLRLVPMPDSRAVVFGYHYDDSRTAADGGLSELLTGAPDWIGQPEVRHRLATGQLGFVYGHFSGTWARASYPGDPWQPLDDGFQSIAYWLVSDEETEYELAEQMLMWAGPDLNANELKFGAMGLIRAAAGAGIGADDLRDFFALLGPSVGRLRPDGRPPDLRAGLAAAAAFGGPVTTSRAEVAAEPAAVPDSAVEDEEELPPELVELFHWDDEDDDLEDEALERDVGPDDQEYADEYAAEEYAEEEYAQEEYAQEEYAQEEYAEAAPVARQAPEQDLSQSQVVTPMHPVHPSFPGWSASYQVAHARPFAQDKPVEELDEPDELDDFDDEDEEPFVLPPSSQSPFAPQPSTEPGPVVQVSADEMWGAAPQFSQPKPAEPPTEPISGEPPAAATPHSPSPAEQPPAVQPEQPVAKQPQQPPAAQEQPSVERPAADRQSVEQQQPAAEAPPEPPEQARPVVRARHGRPEPPAAVQPPVEPEPMHEPDPVFEPEPGYEPEPEPFFEPEPVDEEQLPAEQPVSAEEQAAVDAFEALLADAPRPQHHHDDPHDEPARRGSARQGEYDSLDEAMRAEPEQRRPRPVEGPAFAELHEWCRARTKVVPSGFTIHVYAANPSAIGYSFDLEPPEVPGAARGSHQLGPLLHALWLEESDPEHGAWMFARIDAAGRTLRVDRWYDSVPSWWEDPVADREVAPADVAWHLDHRGDRWLPSYADRLELSDAGTQAPGAG